MPSQRSILIIDNAANVRRELERALDSAGFLQHGFASVEEFISHAPLGAAGCVLADLSMTALAGIDLKRLLHAAGCALPIIYLTAHDSEETRAAARKAGAAGYFHKPVDTQRLLGILEQLLPLNRAARPA